MYQGKHLAPKTKKKAAASYRKRKVALILSLALIMTAAIGGTAAYFMDTESSSNQFAIGKVSCTVAIADDNRSITVTNTGNVPADIRVAVVANWVSETDPNEIHYTQPNLDNSDIAGWSYNTSDGLYYCNSDVSAGNSVTLNIDPVGTAPVGYRLQILALAEAIQHGVAPITWKYSPSGN